ncbi:glycosyltransferase family 39 protein [Phragmitibacter flavus]|uniref:Glycosyltransferase family 39 protein n=1 Tax=Phragmitibacter flavus TaxID=2576071 RepID=A0A5R8KEB5_9BACT|nr:glycosyltransferase family 39 protein [Phragmitibacter flavus]TLD70648.1 glycosyltransferase family 39 protein [Phragmitibacter flavus]
MSAPRPTRRIPGFSWCLNLPLRYGKANAALLATLAVALISGLIYLAEAENPWGKTVQKRLTKGQELQLNEWIIIGLWWAVLASAVILVVLLITHRWWLPKIITKEVDAPKPRSNRLWLVPILAAMAICLWQGIPRLSQSLWNDEEYAMRRFAHGAWETQKDGTLAFTPVTWKETLFSNRLINNHLVDSLLTRLSLNTWRTVTGAPREAFSETAVRLPSLLAALASIALVAWLGTQVGSPLLGAASAILLAFIPWHVHYATDAKGYSELMFFILLHTVGLIKALQTNRIRWWLLFGLSEAAYLLCFPASIYLAVVTNLIVLIELLRSRRFNIIPTLIAFNLIGAIPVIIWAAPSIPQALLHLSKAETGLHPMDSAWLRDLFCSLYLGFGYQNLLPDQHFGTSWTAFRDTTPWLLHTGFAIILIPLLALVGLIAACCKNITARLAIVAPLLAAALSFAHNSANNSPMVVWHYVFILPSLALLICLGITTLARNHRLLAPILLTLIIAAYAYSVHDATQLKRNHDRQPIRQTAQWINQQSTNSLVATWGVSDNQSASYLPRARVLDNLDELLALESEARSQKLPLFVFFCGEVTATTQRNPDLTQHIRESGHYLPVAEFKGLEELFSYRIFKWQPKLTETPPPPAPASEQPPTATSLQQSAVPDVSDP